LILPSNEGHPVKRVTFATEVDHDKTINREKEVRKQHTQEYKSESVKLAEKIGFAQAARELSLHESQLYDWRQKAHRQHAQSELEQSQATEIVRLKRQLAEQTEELAILKKAATYFAKNLK
jgi:transposase